MIPIDLLCQASDNYAEQNNNTGSVPHRKASDRQLWMFPSLPPTFWSCWLVGLDCLPAGLWIKGAACAEEGPYQILELIQITGHYTHYVQLPQNDYRIRLPVKAPSQKADVRECPQHSKL